MIKEITLLLLMICLAAPALGEASEAQSQAAPTTIAAPVEEATPEPTQAPAALSTAEPLPAETPAPQASQGPEPTVSLEMIQDPQTVILVAMEELEEMYHEQTLTLGSGEAPLLPSTLTGQTDQGKTAVLAVTWEEADSFAQPGEYALTPQMPYGYELAQEAELPQISLTVLPPPLQADSFEKEGLTYRVKGEELHLTGGKESSHLTVPQTVAGPDGQDYPVGRVASSAFEGSSIESLTFQGSVSAVGESSFKNCNDLSQVDLPKGLTSLGRSACQNCNGLTEITLPASLSVVGDNIFADSESLEKVILDEGSTIVGAGAFRGCTNLQEVTVPSTVTAMGPGAFENCSSLVQAPLSSGMRAIPKAAFSGCTGLKTADIPQGVTAIGPGAFENCESLEQVTIQGALTAIGANAFAGCSKDATFTVYHEETRQALLAYGISDSQIDFE